VDGEGPAVVVTVFGATLPELFESAAHAVFDLSYDLRGVAPTYSRPVVAPGDDGRGLLVNWLNELLAESDRSGLAFALFMVDRLEEGGVQGSASGMPIAETVRRQRRAEAVSDAQELVAGHDEWSVSFTVRMTRPLRVVGSGS
jgi:SHS2 domain-containing protein